MTIKLSIIKPAFIDFAWRDGANKLAECCKLVDEITGDQLKMLLSRGERHLVAMQEDGENIGWGTFRIDQLPNMRVFYVTDMYAPDVHFERFYDLLKDMARTAGCSRVRCAAPPAQARLYQMKCAFKQVYTTLEIEV